MNPLDDVQPPGDPLNIDYARPSGTIVSMGPSEAQKAAAFKARAGQHLIELCALMDEAMREGLMIRYANIGLNPYGRHEVIDLHVMKRF